MAEQALTEDSELQRFLAAMAGGGPEPGHREARDVVAGETTPTLQSHYLLQPHPYSFPPLFYPSSCNPILCNHSSVLCAAHLLTCHNRPSLTCKVLRQESALWWTRGMSK